MVELKEQHSLWCVIQLKGAWFPLCNWNIFPEGQSQFHPIIAGYTYSHDIPLNHDFRINWSGDSKVFLYLLHAQNVKIQVRWCLKMVNLPIDYSFWKGTWCNSKFHASFQESQFEPTLKQPFNSIGEHFMTAWIEHSALQWPSSHPVRESLILAENMRMR